MNESNAESRERREVIDAEINRRKEARDLKRARPGKEEAEGRPPRQRKTTRRTTDPWAWPQMENYDGDSQYHEIRFHEEDEGPEAYVGEKQLRRWVEANPDLQIKEDTPFQISDVKVNKKLTDDTQKQIQRILQQYSVVFSCSKQSLPKFFKHPPVLLKVKEGAKPCRTKEPSWNSAYGRLIRAWAEEGLRTGLLEECCGEWASRIHVAPKPAQGQSKHTDIVKQGLRICADLRDVNLRLHRATSNYPNGIEEIRKAVGYAYYLSADAASQFWSFALDEDSRDILAVHTPLGLLRFTRMPFGCLTAPMIAQGCYRLMLENLGKQAEQEGQLTAFKTAADMRQRCSTFQDDFLFGAHTELELLELLQAFSALCREYNVTLNPAKCRVGFEEEAFFGFIVNKKESRPSEKNPIGEESQPADQPGPASKCHAAAQFSRHRSPVCQLRSKLRTDLQAAALAP